MCNSEHSGDFGSGRFCCAKCARSFSTRDKRAQINEKVSLKLKGDSRCAWNKGKRSPSVLEDRVCRTCQLMFSVKTHSHRVFCSKACNKKTKSWVENQKTQYKNGRPVKGGKTKWFHYGTTCVQGTYELRMCRILDVWKDLCWIDTWEYTNDRISYTWADGTEHTYLLDFKVTTLLGNSVYFETKGFVREHDREKWQTAKKLGLDLRIWFCDDLLKAEESLNIQ